MRKWDKFEYCKKVPLLRYFCGTISQVSWCIRVKPLLTSSNLLLFGSKVTGHVTNQNFTLILPWHYHSTTKWLSLRALHSPSSTHPECRTTQINKDVWEFDDTFKTFKAFYSLCCWSWFNFLESFPSSCCCLAVVEEKEKKAENFAGEGRCW